jgi:hypothetical protein
MDDVGINKGRLISVLVTCQCAFGSSLGIIAYTFTVLALGTGEI